MSHSSADPTAATSWASSGWAVLAAWAVAVALAVLGLAPTIVQLAEGIDASYLGLAGPIAFAVALLAALVLTVRWALVRAQGRRRWAAGASCSAGSPSRAAWPASVRASMRASLRGST